MSKLDSMFTGRRRMLQMRGVNLSNLFVLLLCLLSTSLAVYRLYYPYQRVCEHGTGAIDAGLHLVEGAPGRPTDATSAVATTNESVPLTEDEKKQRHALCRRHYPISNAKLVSLVLNADLPGILLAVHAENDIISDMVLKGTVLRSNQINLLTRQYTSPAEMEGKVFVDLGANIGLFTLPMLALGYHVVAVEPLDSNVRLLQHSTCLNGFTDRLHMVPFGVGYEDTLCWVIASQVNLGGGHSACTKEEQTKLLQEPSRSGERYVLRSITKYVTLDDAIPADATVAVMKVDLEGYESKVFTAVGGERLFGNITARPHIVLSRLYHSKSDSGCEGDESFVRQMLAWGYVMTTPGSTEYKSELEDICSNPPPQVVWVDRGRWDYYLTKVKS